MRTPDIPHDETFEVNGPILNLVVLCDNSRIEGSSVQSGSDPPSPHDRNKEGNSHTPTYVERVARLASFV